MREALEIIVAVALAIALFVALLLLYGFFAVFVISMFADITPKLEWWELIIVGAILRFFFLLLEGRGRKHGEKSER